MEMEWMRTLRHLEPNVSVIKVKYVERKSRVRCICIRPAAPAVLPGWQAASPTWHPPYHRAGRTPGDEGACWCLKGKSSLSENVSWFNLFLLVFNATSFPARNRILRCFGHQVFSFTVTNLRSFRICLARVGTVVKPAEHEVAHRWSRSPGGGVSPCFPLDRRSTLCSVGGRTGIWHVTPRVQQTACLLWDACDPGLQQAAWAHNLWKVGAQSKRHSDVAVDLRRVGARWEVGVRNVRKTVSKMGKECTCSVWSSEVQHRTLRDEVWLFWVQDTNNVLRDSLSYAVRGVSAWLCGCMYLDNCDNKLGQARWQNAHEKNVSAVGVLFTFSDSCRAEYKWDVEEKR